MRSTYASRAAVAALAFGLIFPLPGHAQSTQAVVPTPDDARRELQRAGIIRGRPGGDVATKAPITKDELVQLMGNVVARIRTVQGLSRPTAAPLATGHVPVWLVRRLPNAPVGALIAGLSGWEDPRSYPRRQEAIVVELRATLAQIPIHEGNPRARIPKVADDAEIAPRNKFLIYQGLAYNLIRVDRDNKLHPNAPQTRDAAFFTAYQVLRSTGAQR